MELNLFFRSFFIVAVAILVPYTSAREVPGETMVAVQKEETLNEAIRDLVGHDDASDNRRASLPTTKIVCNDHPMAGQGGPKRFADDIEPRPDVTSYGDDDLGLKGKRRFADDIEPRPDVTSYRDDDFGLKRKKKTDFFIKDIEPRPDVTSYRDDNMGLKGKKHFSDDVEPRPDVTSYGDGVIASRTTSNQDPMLPLTEKMNWALRERREIASRMTSNRGPMQQRTRSSRSLYRLSSSSAVS